MIIFSDSCYGEKIFSMEPMCLKPPEVFKCALKKMSDILMFAGLFENVKWTVG